MKKLLFVLPLVAGASWASTTYYAGSQTQPAYDKLISQLNQLKPLVVESVAYEAGFLNSTAITSVKLSSSPNAEVLFTLKHEINHSALSVDDGTPRVAGSSIHTTLLMDETSEAAQRVLQKFNNQQPFELNTYLGYNGEVTNELILSSLTQELDGSHFQFDGGNFQFHSTDSGATTGSGQLGELTMNFRDGQMMSISPMHAALNLQRLSDGIFSGTSLFEMPMVALDPANGNQPILFEGVKLASDTSLSGEIMQSSVEFEVAAIDAPLDINSASFSITSDGSTLAGFEQYLALVEQAESSLDMDTDGAMVFLALQDAYKALFEPGFSMGMNMAITNSGGVIEAKSDVFFKGDGSESGYEHMSSVRDVMAALDLGLHLKADDGAVQATPLAMFSMHPLYDEYVVFDGAAHTVNITVADLFMDINGNAQSLDDKYGEVLSMPLPDFTEAF